MEGKAGKAKRTEVLSHHRGAQLRYSWRAWKIKDSFRILGDDHVKVRNTFTGSRNRRAGRGGAGRGRREAVFAVVCQGPSVPPTVTVWEGGKAGEHCAVGIWTCGSLGNLLIPCLRVWNFSVRAQGDLK